MCPSNIKTRVHYWISIYFPLASLSPTIANLSHETFNILKKPKYAELSKQTNLAVWMETSLYVRNYYSAFQLVKVESSKYRVTQAILIFDFYQNKIISTWWGLNILLLRNILQQVYNIKDGSIECSKMDCQKLWKAQHLFTFSIHITSIPANLAPL